MVEPRVGGKLLGMLGFRGGLVVGLALPFLIEAGVAVRPVVLQAPIDYLTVIRSSGAALTARGATAVVLKEYSEVLTQVCRGACDDLEVDSGIAPYGYQVQVLDHQGHCLSCDPGTSTMKDGRMRSVILDGAIVQTSHE